MRPYRLTAAVNTGTLKFKFATGSEAWRDIVNEVKEHTRGRTRGGISYSSYSSTIVSLWHVSYLIDRLHSVERETWWYEFSSAVSSTNLFDARMIRYV